MIDGDEKRRSMSGVLRRSQGMLSEYGRQGRSKGDACGVTQPQLGE